jgi:3-methyladenine DNA glycosylase AlkD
MSELHPAAPTDIADRLRRAFEPHRDPTGAAAMARYMRDQFPFFGVPGPARERLQRDALADLPPPAAKDLPDVALTLWRMPEREYQYAACGILARYVRQLDAAFIPTLRELVTTKSWWDTVDTLASHVAGPIVRAHPSAAPAIDEWIEAEDFWLARVAILHQLRAKRATDAARLFRYCEMRADDPEFFIRKAIGWALREYSKTDAAAVRAFVADHETTLSPLSKREALLWLNGGRKGGPPRG